MKYVPHSQDETQEMLGEIGCNNIQELFASIPDELKTKNFDFENGLSELELENGLSELANQNKLFDHVFLGAGAYNHYIPAAVDSLANRAEFVTPYTPYQPEVSQGTLQVMFEYQSYICRLTGMDVSNASHYDGATSSAEAGLICRKITRKEKLIVPDNLHPHYQSVIKTVCGENVVSIDCSDGLISKDLLEKELDDSACVFLPYPDFWGNVQNYEEVAEFIKSKNVLIVAVVTEPLALALFKEPSSWNADFVVGEGMSFGLPLSFGGPTLGIFACREKYMRNMPGRICGETTDKNGKRSFVLTLATREQHIRRQRATSNICSNQALCALRAVIYMSLLGSKGLYDLAKINFNKAEYAKQKLKNIDGVEIVNNGATFNEFTVSLKKPANEVLSYCKTHSVLAGVSVDKWYPKRTNNLIICCTEMNSKNSIDNLANIIAEALR